MTTSLAILLFDGLTALDAVGPYEVSSRVPGIELSFVATGVSSGIDMALVLAAELAGDDPQPPFDAGSPAKAPAPVVEHQRAHSRFARRGGANGCLLHEA